MAGSALTGEPIAGRSSPLPRWVPWAFLAAAVILLLGCAPSGPAAPSEPPPGSVYISAANVEFEQQSVTAPAGEAFEIFFENREAVPHNVHVLAPDGTSVMQGEIFNGPSARLHPVPALAAGTYRVLCDVHPDMTLDLVAQP